MAFPLPANTTCDIYRSVHSPPAAPDVAGVSGTLTPRGRNIKALPVKYTHWIEVPLATDIRDADYVWVPDKNGTKFTVRVVQRIRAGGGNDYKRAYLDRNRPTWPTNNL